MDEQERERLVAAYAGVIGSFGLGLQRLLSAEAASARLNCALLAYQAGEKPSLEGNPQREVFENLERIPYGRYDALAYITDVSHLVYATTLLDTFLTDTTLFLFLLHPQAMGKSQQILVTTLIGASSTHEVLAAAAAAKAREISYLGFPARLKLLRERFGLKLDLDQWVVEALDHYPSVRNAAVHDQGVYEPAFDTGGRVVARQKTCPRHPTRVSGRDVSGAVNAYQAVFRVVAEAVVGQVLKSPEHPVITRVIAGLAEDDFVAAKQVKQKQGAPGVDRDAQQGDEADER